MDVFKRRDFARWQAREGIFDAVLCEAVWEMESGLIDASLGGLLYKKRVPRPGGGKRAGYRTLLSARIGSCYVFLHGFSKSAKEDITPDEQNAFQLTGRAFLELTPEGLINEMRTGVLSEVCCGKQNH